MCLSNFVSRNNLNVKFKKCVKYYDTGFENKDLYVIITIIILKIKIVFEFSFLLYLILKCQFKIQMFSYFEIKNLI